MSGWISHLVILPVVVPLIAGALMLFFDERSRNIKVAINIVSTAGLFAVAFLLLRAVDSATFPGEANMGVYLVGNWAPPFAIVLVADRLSALMLLLTATLALAALVFSLARWHKAGPHFHSMFQFLLMGVNGAFLTGDLFNLFVFFEVMLASSYGLVLHGSGTARVRAGLHYIAINLAAAMLFLIGVALIYGTAGTLNMADLATRIPGMSPDNRMLMEAGAGILGIAFLVKAGIWPLGLWLPNTYTAAAAPVAAIFAILSKVGIYVILRLSLLLFGAETDTSFGFGAEWLLVGGMATIVFGAIGVLASQAMGRLAGYSVLVSSGTLLAAIGTGDAFVTGGALYYLVSSTVTISALFLLIELVERGRDPGADVIAVTMEAYGDADEEEEEEEVGVEIPATMAILGACFATTALLLAGMPPLSGFIAKFAMLSGMLDSGAFAPRQPISPANWTLAALLIVSGLAALVAMTRAGIRTFWAPLDGTVPRVLVMEVAPIILLLALCVAITVQGGPVMRYMQATAQSLHVPDDYIRGVLEAAPVGPNAREAAR